MGFASTPLDIWLPIGITCFGLVFVAIAAKTLRDSRRQRRTWILRPGRIVRSRLDTDGIRFQVAFDNNGTEQTFWNRFYSGSGIDPVGKTVDVRVNPQNPADAVVVRGVAATGMVTAVAFLVFGAFATTIGAVLLSRAR